MNWQSFLEDALAWCFLPSALLLSFLTFSFVYIFKFVIR